MISKIAYRSTLITGALSAIGATACCVLPLAAVTLGLGGAWLASLRSLESLQPFFVLAALGCIAFAFYSLYIQPKRCAPGEACASPAVLRRQRTIFWLVVSGIVLLGLFYSSLFLLE